MKKITKKQVTQLIELAELNNVKELGIYKYNGKIETYIIINGQGIPEPIYNNTIEYKINILEYLKEMLGFYTTKKEKIELVYNYINETILNYEKEV